MARILGMSDLAARKQALITESEVYRQTLMLEVEQVRLQARAIHRRWSAFTSPMFLLAPFLGSWLTRTRNRVVFGKKPFGWRRWVLGAWTAWRLYRQFGPVLSGLLAARQASRRPAIPVDQK